MFSTATVRVIGKEIVDANLVLMAPRILATNRAMVTGMLAEIKPAVYQATPIGPGHFGYHGRDTLKTNVSSKGVKTTGKLSAAVQLYWREFGTGLRYRGPKKRQFAVRALTGQAGTGGERAFLPATKALNLLRRLIRFYYGNATNWWGHS